MTKTTATRSPADPHGLRQQYLHSVGLATFARSDGLFVHDFVRIALPFDTVVGAFANFVNSRTLRDLILDAWEAELSEVGQFAPRGTPPDDEPAVDVAIGPPRARRDALVIPITWRSCSAHWIPPVEADLEAVAFGPARTHLHIVGLSHLPPGVLPLSDRASLENRLTVAIVRHVLAELAETIERAAPA